MSNFIQVDNLNILNNLRNHEEGEVAYIKDKKKFFTYREGEWVEVKPNEDLFKISLYQMNQMILGELPELTKEEKEKATKLICNYIYDPNHTDEYYMLLCHDLKYFTVFAQDTNCDSKETIEKAIFDCLDCVGVVKSIELTKDATAIEIWVTTPEGDTYVMYFFDYGRGIVPCRI